MPARVETRDVVIRWHPWSEYYVCYAVSYQPTWQSMCNMFETRADAEKAIKGFNAERGHDCKLNLVEHEHDQNREKMPVKEFFAA